MIDLCVSKDIKKRESELFSQGVDPMSLIEKASRGLVDNIPKNAKNIAIVVGGGNNGSDGICAGLLLLDMGKSADVFTVCSGKTEEWRELFQKFQSVGNVYSCDGVDFSSYDCILDCVFGIGLSRKVEGKYEEIIHKINESGKPVISADVPSGLDCDTGKVMGVCVKADKTVSFSGTKLGYLLEDGSDYVAEVVLVDTGIKANPCAQLVDGVSFSKRRNNTHKGSYGKISIIAGSARYVGASLLSERSAHSALRAGAGLVKLCVPRSLKEVYAKRVTESTLFFLPDDGESILFDKNALDEIISTSSVIVVGMGLTSTEEVQKTVCYILDNAKCEVIVDADGLNALVGKVDSLKSPYTRIITPHVGEFARLIGKPISEIRALEDGVNFAREYDVILHLKGCASLTCYPSGLVRVTANGSPCMAKGGSGDVLSGIIASFVAQGVENPVESASFVHGEAGKRAEKTFGEHGVLARDIADSIPSVMKNYVK